MDLPELARRGISEEVIATLSQTLHERPQQVWASMSAAIPTVLWFYAEKVGTPDGADQLAAAVTQRSTKTLERLPEVFGGPQAQTLLTDSQRQFTALFNRDATDALSHAISGFSGMSIDSSGLVVGATHLIALASLRKESHAGSGRELARLISEGKPSIAAAIPEGLHDQLDSIPRLHQLAHQYDDGVPATAGDDQMAGEAVLHRQETAPAERYYAAEELDRVPGSLIWLAPILIALVIGAVMVFTIYPRSADNQVTSVNPPAVTSAREAQPAGATIDGPRALRELQLASDPLLTSDMAVLLEQFTGTLREMRRSASFAEVSSTLTHVNQESSRLLTRYQRLPLDQQQRLGALMSQLLPSVQSSASETSNLVADSHLRMQISDVMRVLRQFTQQPA